MTIQENPEPQDTNNSVNCIKRDIFVGTIAAILGGTILGIPTFFYGKFTEKRIYTQRFDNAPQIYIEELDKLIKTGVEENQNQSIKNARAIVTARNETRKSLENISKSLNSEIDKLDQQLNNSTKHEELFDTITVLQKTWPTKEKQIEIEVSKVMEEMGLDPK